MARAWTLVEDMAIIELYAEGGAEAVAKVVKNRSLPAICQRACRLKVFNTASPFSRAGTGEPAVPLPAPHDYAPEDHAWMATRLPVFVGGFGAAVIGRVSA